MLPCPSHLFCPSFPSPGACDPKPFLPSSRAPIQGLVGPDSLSCARAPLPLGLSLTAITARSSRDERGCRISEAGQLVPGFWC